MDKYRVLGLSRDATDDEIRATYKALALKWHPDRHRTDKVQATEKFVEINAAYQEIVVERQRRAKWSNSSDGASTASSTTSSSAPSSPSPSTPPSPPPSPPASESTPPKPTAETPSAQPSKGSESDRGRSSSRSEEKTARASSDSSHKSRNSSPSSTNAKSDSSTSSSSYKGKNDSSSGSRSSSPSSSPGSFPSEKSEDRSSRSSDSPRGRPSGVRPGRSRESSPATSSSGSPKTTPSSSRAPSADTRSLHSESAASDHSEESNSSSGTEYRTPDAAYSERSSSPARSSRRGGDHHHRSSTGPSVDIDDCGSADGSDVEAEPVSPKAPRAKLRKQSRPSSRRPDGSDTTPKPSPKRRKSETIDETPIKDQIPLSEYTYPLPRGLANAREWTHTLPLTLEEFYRGKHFCFRLVRNKLSGKKKNVVLDVDVPAGCRKGTKILFRNAGHEKKDGTRQDIAFVIEEVEHERFTRVKDDVYLDIRLPWMDSLHEEPGEVFFDGVDGREYMFQVNYKRDRGLSGTHTIWKGGMPTKDGDGKKKGKMIVRWEIVPPTQPSRWTSFKEALRFGT